MFEGVGYLHTLTRDIFPGHPCCTLSVTDRFMREAPNAFRAMLRAVVRSIAYADVYENRPRVAELLAPATYLSQPRTVLEQVLLGRYADGLGRIVEVRDRIGFDPFPYGSTAIWILTQLKRWNFIPKDVNYAEVAQRVFLTAEAGKRMREADLPVPASGLRKHAILGREFDPSRADEYLAALPMRRG